MTWKNKVLVEEYACHRPFVGVIIKDDFTDIEPIGEVELLIGDIKKTYIRKGPFFLINDFPEDAYEVSIKADYYFDIKVKDKDISVGEPVYLTPKPSYPFPSGSTIVRGFVEVKDGSGVTSPITIGDQGFNGQINENGEYVLYISQIKLKGMNETDKRKTYFCTKKIKVNLNIPKTIPQSGQTSKNSYIEIGEIEIGKTKVIKGEKNV